MENPQQENNKQESYGFKPNWGIVLLIAFLVFLGAFLGGYLASLMGSGMITKKIKSFFDKKEEAERQSLTPKPKPNIKTIDDDSNAKEEDEAEEENSIIAQHKKFRESALPKKKQD